MWSPHEKQGWRIQHIDVPMTLHDLAISSFSASNWAARHARRIRFSCLSPARFSRNFRSFLVV